MKHAKLFLSAMLAALMLLCVLPVSAKTPSVGEVTGHILYTDIVAYVNGRAIPSYNLGGYTLVIAEDLDKYGFDCEYDSRFRELYILRGEDKAVTASYVPKAETHKVGSPAMDVLYTDISAYIEGQKVTSYNLGGATAIRMDDLARICGGNYRFDAASRTLKLSTANVSSAWSDNTLSLLKTAAAALNDKVEVPVRDISDDIESLKDLLSSDSDGSLYWISQFRVASVSCDKASGQLNAEVELWYAYSKDMIRRCNAAANQICAEAEKLSGDYEKALYVHDYLIDHVAYAESDADTVKYVRGPSSSVVGCLLDHKAVCQGYTETYKYLLDRLGIECRFIYGGNHSWNAVKLEGKWYYVDVTWDDPVPDGSKLHYYFGITTDMLLTDHVIESGLDVPVCDSMDCNWYVRSGCYIEKYSLSAVYDLISKAAKNSSGAEMMFSDGEEYQKALDELVGDGAVFDIMEDAGIGDLSFTYSEYEEFHILSFSFGED